MLADSRVGIPSNFLFRTGGDTTVRGYAFESLGVQQGDAIVGGRYYAVASVEVDALDQRDVGHRRVRRRRQRHRHAVTISIPRVGYGVGARLRTPIGPFRLDVAYGAGRQAACACTSPSGCRSERQASCRLRLSPRRRRWWLRVIVALAIVAGASRWSRRVLGCSAARRRSTTWSRRAVAAADGHLTIEGAEGSLLSTVRIARIAWRGDEVDVEARETALTWSPFDLLSRKLIVQGLGAQRLSLDFKKSQKSASGLPATLALPLEVDVRNIGVERLEWRTGERSGYVTGVTFDYSGGARSHAIRALRFVTRSRHARGQRADGGRSRRSTLSGALDFEGDGAVDAAARRSSRSPARSSASASTPRARCAMRR